MPRTALKNTLYSRNGNFFKIAKIGHHAKAMVANFGLCKMVSLAQKLKFSKTCQKRLHNHIRVVLCKKQLQKTPNIREMATCLKSLNLATIQRHGAHLFKIVSLGKKLKFLKTYRKQLYYHIRVVLCKKRLQETPNI